MRTAAATVNVFVLRATVDSFSSSFAKNSDRQTIRLEAKPWSVSADCRLRSNARNFIHCRSDKYLSGSEIFFLSYSLSAIFLAYYKWDLRHIQHRDRCTVLQSRWYLHLTAFLPATDSFFSVNLRNIYRSSRRWATISDGEEGNDGMSVLPAAASELAISFNPK